MSHTYDLLPHNSRCDTFKVNFDVYTPRPHFIILPHERSLVGHDYNYLDNSERLKVIKAAVELVSHNTSLKHSAILSIHTGSWISTRDMFLAHVCVDVDDYLKIYAMKKSEIPEWPSTKFVTRQWKASRNHRDYAMNVRGYPFKTYFKQEVIAIKANQRQKLPNKSSGGASEVPSKFTILYHPSEPKIGFAVEKSEISSCANLKFLLEAQEALFKFATDCKLTDMSSKNEDNGCHVCLILNEKRHGFDDLTDSSLVGYIQVTGLKFYTLCPPNIREEWFAQFQKMEDYGVHT
ncbi:PREDICTED: uncharacterized protein LOC107348834 isoform X1 [Acropora digitifera]|uniref:uncharacterized protein LOC107348834 isoform X1 n=1 Tax=Acropora digitifera TaxID=70779 RepID=UPI00077A2695|nr:PREDICTED: uncharacterized protein LOC107348834 isoform X1 [Acropora digitifera]